MAIFTAAAAGVWLILLTVADLRSHRLPNALTLPGAGVILVGAALAGALAPAVLGAVALTGLYGVAHLMSPAQLGAGDVKLAIGLGALTGPFGTLLALLRPRVAGRFLALVVAGSATRSLSLLPRFSQAFASFQFMVLSAS